MLMAAVHPGHVDSPEYDVAPTDRSDVKAWDGEEVLEIPPSTGLFRLNRGMSVIFYGAKIKAWCSAWAQECLVVSWKTTPTPPHGKKKNLPEINFIALVQKEGEKKSVFRWV